MSETGWNDHGSVAVEIAVHSEGSQMSGSGTNPAFHFVPEYHEGEKPNGM